jgi:hypothetical protein
MPTGVEGRQGEAALVHVGPDGAVDTVPSESESVTTNVFFPTGVSTMILPVVRNRRQFQLQNLSESALLHIRLETGSVTATVADLAVFPGDIYLLPAGVSYTGEVWGWTPAGTPFNIVAIEFLGPYPDWE